MYLQWLNKILINKKYSIRYTISMVPYPSQSFFNDFEERKIVPNISEWEKALKVFFNRNSMVNHWPVNHRRDEKRNQKKLRGLKRPFKSLQNLITYKFISSFYWWLASFTLCCIQPVAVYRFLANVLQSKNLYWWHHRSVDSAAVSCPWSRVEIPSSPSTFFH